MFYEFIVSRYFYLKHNINIRSISRQYFDNSLPIGNIYVFNDNNKNVLKDVRYMYLIHAHVFLYKDILDMKWIFVIHYDSILRNVFEDASINTEKNNDDQTNIVEGEQIGIHDDIQVEEDIVE